MPQLEVDARVNESKWERAAFIAYLAVVGLLPFRFGSVKLLGLVITLTDAAFVAAAALWLGAWIFGKFRPRMSGLYWPMAAYAAAMAVSIIGSSEPKRSAVKFVGELYLLGLAFLSVNLVTSEAKLARVCKTWLFVTAATVIGCVVGIAFFYLGVRDRSLNLVLWNYGSLPPGNYPRLCGFFANGNMLCNYLIVSVMFAFVAWQRGLLSQKVALVLLGLSGVTAAFTFSTGIGGIAVAGGVWLFLQARGTDRELWGKLALASGSVVGVGLLVATTVSLSGDATRVAPRLLLWADALRTFAAHPITGKGVGTDPVLVHWVNPSGVMENLTEAHNVFLSIAAQEGVVGLLAFIWLVVWLLHAWWHSPSGPWTRALGCAFLGSLLYQGLSGAFEDARHVWVLMGLFCAAMTMIKEVPMAVKI